MIERFFRATHILVTLRREDLIREGRREELDDLAKTARQLQDSLLPDQGSG